MQAGDTAPAGIGAVCGAHPDRPGPSLCSRCGNHLCAECIGIEERGSLRCKACVLRASPRPPWSPGVVAAVTFFTGFLGGGVLHALNYERLGHPRRTRLRIAATAGLFLAYVGLMMMVPEGARPNFIGLLVGALFAGLYASTQFRLFEVYKKAGGKPAPWWSGTLLGVGLNVGAVVLVLGGWFAFVTLEVDAADRAFDEGDHDEAYVRYRAACRIGEPSACTMVGLLFERGWGVSQDDRQARAYYDQGCELGDPVGCANLAALYRDGRGGPIDLEQAFVLFVRACDDGVAVSCTGLGYLYDTGLGIGEDRRRARALYEQGCRGGDPVGCVNLAFLLEDGAGGPADPARARELHDQACREGELTGCRGLASMLELGQVVPRDEPRALSLFTRACDGGDGWSCFRVAAMLTDGRGAAADPVRARERAEQACDASSAEGCGYLAYLLGEGVGGAPDPGRAQELAARACQLGDAASCPEQ